MVLCQIVFIMPGATSTTKRKRVDETPEIEMKKTKFSSESEASKTNQKFAKPEENSKFKPINRKARNLIEFFENFKNQSRTKLNPSPAEERRKSQIQDTLSTPTLPAPQKMKFQPTLLLPPQSLAHTVKIPAKRNRTRAKMAISPQLRKITSFFENVKVKLPEDEDQLRGGEN